MMNNLKKYLNQIKEIFRSVVEVYKDFKCALGYHQYIFIASIDNKPNLAKCSNCGFAKIDTGVVDIKMSKKAQKIVNKINKKHHST